MKPTLPAALLSLAILLSAAVPAGAQSAADSWNEPQAIPAVVDGGSAFISAGASLYLLIGSSVDYAQTPPAPFYRWTAGTWTPLTSMPVGTGLGAAMAYDPVKNQIYAARGGTTTRHFLRYDIASNTWTPATGAGSLQPFPKAYHYGVALATVGSKIYALGGMDVDTGSGKGVYAFDTTAGTWTAAGTLSDLPVNAFRGASFCFPGTDDYLYALAGAWAGGTFLRYSISGNSWTSIAPLPEPADVGGSMIAVSATQLVAWSGNMDDVDQTGHFRFTIDKTSPTGGSWTALAKRPGGVGNGAGLAFIGPDTIYGVRGRSPVGNAGSGELWRYSIAGDRWLGLNPAPNPVEEGSRLVSVGNGDDLYLLQGYNRYGFSRYSVQNDSWTPLQDTPDRVWHGGSMVYAGTDTLYVLRGAGATDFWAYNIPSQNWVATPLAAAPQSVSTGSQLVWAGGSHLYCFFGGTTTVHRYEISSNTWDAASLAAAPATIQSGSAAVPCSATPNLIYVLRGNGPTFWIYNTVTNAWNNPVDPQDLPSGEAAGSTGSSLCYPGAGKEIYAFNGYTTPTLNGHLLTFMLPDAVNPAGSWTLRARSPGTTHNGAQLA